MMTSRKFLSAVLVVFFMFCFLNLSFSFFWNGWFGVRNGYCLEVIRKTNENYPSWFRKKKYLYLPKNSIGIVELFYKYILEGVRVTTDGLAMNLKLPFTIKGEYSLLDLVKMFSDWVEVRWDKNGLLEIKSFIVKRFTIPYPGTDYQMTQSIEASSGGLQGAAVTGSSNSAGGSTIGGAGGMGGAGGNSAHISMGVNWWEDFEKQLQTLLNIGSESISETGLETGEGLSALAPSSQLATVPPTRKDSTSVPNNIMERNISPSTEQGQIAPFTATEGISGVGVPGLMAGNIAGVGEDFYTQSSLRERYKPFYVIDKFTNTVVVGAPVWVMKRVEKFVDSVKKKLSQTIEVEITFFEVSNTNEEYRGVSWQTVFRALLFSHPKGFFLDSPEFAYGMNSDLGVDATETGGNLGTFFLKSTNPADKQSLIINVLSKVAKVRVIDRTTLLLKHGTMTAFSVGTKAQYIASTTKTTTENGETSYTVEKGEVVDGLVVTLSGFVEGKKIHLTLQPNYTYLVGVEAVKMGDTTIQNPTIRVRQSMVSLTLKDGETTAIVGYNRDNLSSTNDKIPGLGDLPVVGWLFSKKVAKDKKSTLIMLITARVKYE